MDTSSTLHYGDDAYVNDCIIAGNNHGEEKKAMTDEMMTVGGRRPRQADETTTTTTAMTTTTTTDDDDDVAVAVTSPCDRRLMQENEFSGVEAFLVGISPIYWAHIPMSILDLHKLQRINGIQCMVLPLQESNHNRNHNDSNALVAVSKCSLVGMVVLVEQRPGSILFVLDDGTALIDCLLWMDKDIFELPSLTGEITSSSVRLQDDCCPHVGQMVRVLGRIECVSVQNVAVAAAAVGAHATRGTTAIGRHHGEATIQQHCIREIHVTLVEPIPVMSQAQPHSLNAESLHWLECSRRFGSSTESTMPMMNANYILQHYLGPDIAAQVYRRESLPSTHDKMASWKLFGVACRCRSEALPYKDELLYCHCQATGLIGNSSNSNNSNDDDDNDSGFVYRDALLNRLLELQAQHQQQELHLSGNDGNIDTDNVKQQQPLQFQYKAVATDSQLMAVLDNSMKMKTSSTTTASSLTLQQQQQQQQQKQHRRSRIIQKTFAALRKDGILALLCVEADVYLLISRTFVLEPYIRITQQQQQNSSSSIGRGLPDCLSNVPKARLEFVRRTMST
jgi:hypothetical protein